METQLIFCYLTGGHDWEYSQFSINRSPFEKGTTIKYTRCKKCDKLNVWAYPPFNHGDPYPIDSEWAKKSLLGEK